MLNSDRFLVQELISFASENGLQLEEFCHNWTHKLTNPTTGKSSFIFGYDLGLNPSSVAQICRDKVATSEILLAAGIAVVPHRLIIQPNLVSYAPNATTFKVLEWAFDASDGEIVIKPNEGTGGSDVFRTQSIAKAVPIVERILSMDKAVAVCPYIEIENEWRVYVLNGEAKIALRKVPRSIQGDGICNVESLARRKFGDEFIDDLLQNSTHLSDEWRDMGTPSYGQTVNINWRNNLNQGAQPVMVELPSTPAQIIEMAIQVAAALGLMIGSVDIVRTNESLYVLEVNSGVMMEQLARMTATTVTIARKFYFEALSVRVPPPHRGSDYQAIQ